MTKTIIHNNANKFQWLINHMKSWLRNSNIDRIESYYAYPHRNNSVNFFRYISRDYSNIPLQYILNIEDYDNLYLFQLNYENIIIVSSTQDIQLSYTAGD